MIGIDGSTASIAGMEIIVSPHMTERMPYPRSPARARRRAAMGHPQHHAVRPSRHIYRIGPNTLVCHPALLDEMTRAVTKAGRP